MIVFAVVLAFVVGVMLRPDCAKCLAREDNPQLCDRCFEDEEEPPREAA